MFSILFFSSENCTDPVPEFNTIDNGVDRRSHMGDYTIVERDPRSVFKIIIPILTKIFIVTIFMILNKSKKIIVI